MPILKEIHLDRGMKDVKIIITASEFFRDTGFRYEDRDIYLAGLKKGDRNNYLLKNYDLFDLRAPIAESSVYESAFTKQIKKFLERSEGTFAQPDAHQAISDDVAKQAQYLISKYAPRLQRDRRMFENDGSGKVKIRLYPPIADDPDDERDPQRRIKHAIMLAAFMRSGEFARAAKSNSAFYTQIANDIVDREIQDHISKSFIAQGKQKTINFINVTNDVDHFNWVKGIIEDSNRVGQSFNMNGYVFRSSCEALASELRAEKDSAKRHLCHSWADALESMVRDAKEDKHEPSFREYVRYVDRRQSGRF